MEASSFSSLECRGTYPNFQILMKKDHNKFENIIALSTSAALSEERGENFEDAMDGLFEGDMRLTGDQLLALGMGKEEEARTKRQGEEGEGGEDEGEFFGDAIEDGLFEGDMRLTGDQLLALQRGTLETHGDLEGVTYSHTFARNSIRNHNITVQRKNI